MFKYKNAVNAQSVLSSVLIPHYTKQYDNIEDLANDVNGIVDYAIDLFIGISKNNNYCFGRTFGYDIRITQNQFLVTSAYNGDCDPNAFMTFISLLQYLFIDERIYLSGKIDICQMIQSGDTLFGTIFEPFSYDDKTDSISIRVSEKVCDNSNKVVIDGNGQYCLAFIDNVFSYAPFKDEEGNILRHITNPLKNTLKECKSMQNKRLNWIIEYFNKYSQKNSFSSALQI